MKTIAVMIGCVLCLCISPVRHAVADAGETVLHRGLIEPSEVIEVSSQVPGIIEKVPVERGDRVKAGQVVAMLKAGVEKAQVDLALTRLDFGKRKMLRNEELHQKQLISIHEKDEMETEVRIMEIQLQEA